MKMKFETKDKMLWTVVSQLLTVNYWLRLGLCPKVFVGFVSDAYLLQDR